MTGEVRHAMTHLGLPPRVLAALRRIDAVSAPLSTTARCADCSRLCVYCWPRQGLPTAYQVYTGEPPDDSDLSHRPVFLGESRPYRDLSGAPDERDLLAGRVLRELESPASPRARRLPGGIRGADEIRAGVPARPRIRRAYRISE